MPFAPRHRQLSWRICALGIALLTNARGATPSSAGAATVPASAEKTRIFFGGFAFAGAAASAEARYPHGCALNRMTDDGTRYLSRLTREIMVAEKSRLARGDLVLGLARNTDTPLVLALAQTEERVLQEKIGANHKLVLTLGFELLLLDFASLEVVSTHPFLIEFIDSAKAPFEPPAIQESMRRMLEGPHSQLRLAVAKRLARIDPTTRNRGALRVDRVLLGPAAPPFLTEEQRVEPEVFKEQLAQKFTALLSERGGVTVLPFTKDALNATMALAFADTTILQFKIPPPTFAVELNLRGFKKVKAETKPAGSRWIYGAYLDLKVLNREFEREYVRDSITETVAKIVPASQAVTDDPSIAAEALDQALLACIARLSAHPEFKKSILPVCKN